MVSSKFLFSLCSLRFFASFLLQTKLSQGITSSVCCLVQHPFKQCTTFSSLVVRHGLENGEVHPRKYKYSSAGTVSTRPFISA